MPSQKNIDQVNKLQENMEKAKSMVLADYRGLNVAQINKLRNKIKESGGEFKVTKNTLLRLAFKRQEFRTQNLELSGPTAILFSYEDEVAPIKTLYEFFKENDLPQIKFGFLEKESLEKDRVIELAQLPSREGLQAKLVGTLNRPVYGLVYVLKGNLQKLAGVLNSIKNKMTG